MGDELLDREWWAFERACEWESVEGKELSGAAFPDTPVADAARLLAQLIELERPGNQRRLVRERERLRRLNRELFVLYMARRAVHYL